MDTGNRPDHNVFAIQSGTGKRVSNQPLMYIVPYHYIIKKDSFDAQVILVLKTAVQ